MKKCALLVIHGIGTDNRDYDLPFKRALEDRLEKLGKDPAELAYQKVFWADFINTRQKDYYRCCTGNPRQKIGWRVLRKAVLEKLGDASSYQRQFGADNKNYFNIVRQISIAVRGLKEQLGGEEAANRKPLIIFAHSLGCFVINNYIWDAHKIHGDLDAGWPRDLLPRGAFEKMLNLTGMITFGCNIPLFVLGHDPVVAIEFPHPDLTDEYKTRARWDNYYDPKDILGWPLKELRFSFMNPEEPPGDVPTYPRVVHADVPIRIWTWWDPRSWTCMSHTMYWTHPCFLNPAADYVAGFL